MAKVFRSTKKKLNTPNIKFLQVYSVTNILLKYNWHLDFMDKEAAMNLKL